jgi:formate hydrogenlyase subunit 3/multisubunit Na+/H+ antiporter MnhD subunit
MTQFFAGTALILFGGMLSLILPERLKATCVCIFTGAGIIPPLNAAWQVLAGAAPWQGSFFGRPFRLDLLAAFFTLFIAIMGFIATLYAMGYIRSYLGKNHSTTSHFLCLPILLVSMLLIPLTQDAILFLILWEFMSLSSFFLVVFENDRKEVLEAGIYYFVMMHISIIFLMVGFALAANAAGSFDFGSFLARLDQNRPLATIIFLCLFAGFGVKAGLIPLHSWLPWAHPAAPSHISGMMSGIMIKLGIYGILRTLMILPQPATWVAYTVLGLGLSSALFGVLYAIAQNDMKRLLAYSSLENMGIIVAGIGLGMLGLAYHLPLMAILGLTGALLHVLNHSIFKELLFYGAGAVYLKTHTRNIDSLGGLIKTMPYTAFFFMIGAIAISGLPPLNGFVSEFLLYMSMLQGLTAHNHWLLPTGIVAVAALAFVGAMALLCFTKIFGVVFLGLPRSEHAKVAPGENRTILVALALLALMCGLIGFFPQYAFQLVLRPATDLVRAGGISAIPASGMGLILQSMSQLFLAMLGVILLLYLGRKLLLGKMVARQKTWDCGYQAGNTRMQYSAASYASPFLKLLSPFVRQEQHLHGPVGLFPRQGSFRSQAQDIFECFLIRPVSRGITRFLQLFSWIQSGNMQQYILYGLIFLILSILWIVGSK